MCVSSVLYLIIAGTTLRLPKYNSQLALYFIIVKMGFLHNLDKKKKIQMIKRIPADYVCVAAHGLHIQNARLNCRVILCFINFIVRPYTVV